ncbi:MAG: GNAT family N-acetyltransferase [Lachnospiraceae bacterium]|nr:GNAT family N-acetyltransferase [Lachnospiraceae bacterium]
MTLAWDTFLTFQTKEYGKEGRKSFYDFISDRALKNFFLKDVYQLFVAIKKERIIGIITLRNECHISLLFVDKDHQRNGVGSALVQYLSDYVLYEKGIDYITVDSAPSAMEFYHKIGFWDLAPMQTKAGISSTAMKKNLKYTV